MRYTLRLDQTAKADFTSVKCGRWIHGVNPLWVRAELRRQEPLCSNDSAIDLHPSFDQQRRQNDNLTDLDDIAGLLDGHDNPRLLVELRGPHGRDHDICTLDGIYEAPVVK
mgnify:CR=1 FL=1